MMLWAGMMLFWKACSASCFVEKVRNSKRLLQRSMRNFNLNSNVNRIQQVQLQIPLPDSYTDYSGLVPAQVLQVCQAAAIPEAPAVTMIIQNTVWMTI